MLALSGLILFSFLPPQTSDITSYVNAFIAQASAHHVDIAETVSEVTIALGDVSDLGDKVIGACFMDTGNIILSAKFWAEASQIQREMLVFHELGHCALKRQHRDDMADSIRPISIMNPTILAERDYKANRSKYLDELFAGY